MNIDCMYITMSYLSRGGRQRERESRQREWGERGRQERERGAEETKRVEREEDKRERGRGGDKESGERGKTKRM